MFRDAYSGLQQLARGCCPAVAGQKGSMVVGVTTYPDPHRVLADHTAPSWASLHSKRTRREPSDRDKFWLTIG